jgi:small GTP-binding protein
MADNRFDPDISPTAAAAFCQWRPEGTDGILIQFWDTSGMEKYRSINQIYYREALAALLVFDMTDRRSFEAIPGWKKDFEAENTVSNAIVVLVGNKCDLIDRIEVLEEETRSWADENGLKYFPVSALTGEGVLELLDGLVRTLPRQILKGKSLSLVLDDPPNAGDNRGCC